MQGLTRTQVIRNRRRRIRTAFGIGVKQSLNRRMTLDLTQQLSQCKDQAAARLILGKSVKGVTDAV